LVLITISTPSLPSLPPLSSFSDTPTPTFAILTQLNTARHLERDKERLAAMRSYADSIGVPYIVSQRRDIGSFWDKQMAVLKQLPVYDELASMCSLRLPP
jgi:hypothetical protein